MSQHQQSQSSRNTSKNSNLQQQSLLTRNSGHVWPDIILMVPELGQQTSCAWLEEERRVHELSEVVPGDLRQCADTVY